MVWRWEVPIVLNPWRYTMNPAVVYPSETGSRHIFDVTWRLDKTRQLIVFDFSNASNMKLAKLARRDQPEAELHHAWLSVGNSLKGRMYKKFKPHGVASTSLSEEGSQILVAYTKSGVRIGLMIAAFLRRLGVAIGLAQRPR